MNFAAVTISRGSVAVLVRISGAILAFLAQVTVARLAGIAEFGTYMFIIGSMNLGVAISKLGLDTSALRFLGVYYGAGDAGRYQGFRHVSGRAVLIASVLVALAAAFFLIRSEPWSGRNARLLLLLLVVAIPCISLSALRVSALLAFGNVFLAYVPELLMRPIIIIAGALLLVLAGNPYGAEVALQIFAIAAIASLAFSTLVVRKKTPVALRVPATRITDVSSWSDAATTLWLSTLGFFALTQADILVVGAILGDAAVGGYAAAARCAIYITLFLVALQRTVAPLISERFEQGDKNGAQQVLDIIASVAAVSGVFAGILILILAEPIMGLFGQEFRSAAVLLRILAIGQVINCLTGASGVAMNMTGHHRTGLIIQLVFSVIGVTMSILAASYFGIIGVAIVTATTIACWNLATVLAVQRKTGLVTWVRYRGILTALRELGIIDNTREKVS